MERGVSDKNVLDTFAEEFCRIAEIFEMAEGGGVVKKSLNKVITLL